MDQLEQLLQTRKLSNLVTCITIDFLDYAKLLPTNEITTDDFLEVLNDLEEEIIMIGQIINPKLQDDIYILSLILEQINEYRITYGGL